MSINKEKIGKDNQSENISIGSLKFSPKVYLALTNKGINTLAELLEYSVVLPKNRSSLINIPSIGEKLAAQIIEKVHSMGYKFFDENELIGEDSLNKHISRTEELYKNYKKLLKQKQEVLRKASELDSKIQNVLNELLALQNGENNEKRR